MRQKSHLHDPFFGLKGLDQRPISVATEIVDTEWDEEEDDLVSEIEDDDPNSPRISLNSVSRLRTRPFPIRHGIILITDNSSSLVNRV